MKPKKQRTKKAPIQRGRKPGARKAEGAARRPRLTPAEREAKLRATRRILFPDGQPPPEAGAEPPAHVLAGAAMGAALFDLLAPTPAGAAFASGLFARMARQHIAELTETKAREGEKPPADSTHLRVIQGGKE